MFQYIVALAILSTAYAVTPVTQCENGLPLTTEVDFNGCTKMPCPLPQGSTAKMNVTFISTGTFETLHVSALAYALGVTVDYPLPENNPCLTVVNTVCPVTEGEEVTFRSSMEILAIFPKIPFSVDISVLDKEGGQGIACFNVQGEVV